MTDKVKPDLADLVGEALLREMGGRRFEFPASWGDLSEEQSVTVRRLALAAIEALKSPPDNVIEALIYWTPSSYQIDMDDRAAYVQMLTKAFSVPLESTAGDDMT